jgi:hypothetical protein
MTLAVATPTPTKPTASVPIVILGTDAVLAALPATAVQLAHACIQAGFVSVIPASWGDELIAAATLRRLPDFGNGPVIQCSCPIVAHRLLSVSGDLRPVLLPLVPPPVALARYLRALSQPNRARVTYVGACPGAIDDSIDIRMTPEALLSMLAERCITLEDQPRVFESFVPADRRRFRSQPGGLPAADVLWSEFGTRTLVEVDGEDLAAEVAQHVLGGRNVLIDAAATLGCACSGAIGRTPAKDARSFLVSLEPPRAAAPVVDEHTTIELELPVPAASRTPVDVMSVPSSQAPNYSSSVRTLDFPIGPGFTPLEGIAAVPETRQSTRAQSPVSRPVGGSSPVVRAADGKEGRTLPRAYVARRRLSPRNTPVVSSESVVDRALRAPWEVEVQAAKSADRAPHSTELIELSATPSVARPLETPPVVANESTASAKTRDSSDATEAIEADEPIEAMELAFSVAVDEPSLDRESLERRESEDSNDVYTRPPHSATTAFQGPLNTRHVVLFLLAVVAIAITVSATLLILVERRLTSSVTAPASNNR